MCTTGQDASQGDDQATRRPWPLDRKIALVLQGLLGRRSIKDLCHEAGVSPACYYQWRQQFIHAAQAGWAHPETQRHALEERVQQLEAENASLRQRLHVLQDICLAD